MPQGLKTLTRWTIEAEHRHPGSTGDFSGLLNAIATSVKVISNQVNRGALLGLLGSAEVENVQGEIQKKLDVVSNDVMINELQWTGHLAAMVSEEMEEIYTIPGQYRRGKYLLVFDPLDGSSNTDVNIPVGTIFSVLRSPDPDRDPRPEDFFQAGTEQVCAGFAVYGPSTMLIITHGEGVDGFTLDRDIGAFILTHPQMQIPEQTSEFAINSSNERFWEPPVRRYVSECLEGSEGPIGRDFNMRWVASAVADAYRILTRGGLFLYPADSRRAGRLRLLYECNPIAFIIEQAGGLASTGRRRILELEPTELHQRAPIVFGSKAEVERVIAYHDEWDTHGTHGSEGSEGLGSGTFDRSLFNTRSLFRTT